MATHTLLAVAATPYGVVHFTQPGTGHAMRDPLHSPLVAAQPRRRAVSARWHSTDAGQLEARWLPTIPAGA